MTKIVTTTILAPGGALAASASSPATTLAIGATSTVAQTLTVASPQLWSTVSPRDRKSVV
jgi:hypothetical protein